MFADVGPTLNQHWWHVLSSDFSGLPRLPASDAIDKDQLSLSNNCRRWGSRCGVQNLPVTESICPLIPGKHQSLIHSWVNDGSPSTTLARHWSNNGLMCLAYGDTDWSTEPLFSFLSTRHQSKAFPMLDQRLRRRSKLSQHRINVSYLLCTQPQHIM